MPKREQFRAIKNTARHPLWWLPDPAAQQDEAFRRVWQNLRTVQEVSDGRHDTNPWLSRNGKFAMACVRVPESCLAPEISGLRAMLAEFPYVRMHPDSFLHIPVQEIGFVCDEPSRREELSEHQLGEFIAMSARPLLDFPKFPITLGPVNSFADAAFLDVHDDGWLSRIHRRMLDFAAFPPSTKYPYLPHVTLAHYDRSAPIGNLPAVLAEWRDLPLGGFMVEHVDVVLLDTSESFPPFEVVHEFLLGTTRATGTIPTRPELPRD